MSSWHINEVSILAAFNGKSYEMQTFSYLFLVHPLRSHVLPQMSSLYIQELFVNNLALLPDIPPFTVNNYRITKGAECWLSFFLFLSVSLSLTLSFCLQRFL